MERDEIASRIASKIDHFNSHAHVERDVFEELEEFVPVISTHTLTWSVTLWLNIGV